MKILKMIEWFVLKLLFYGAPHVFLFLIHLMYWRSFPAAHQIEGLLLIGGILNFIQLMFDALVGKDS